MLLGEHLGLDAQILGDIINTSTGQSWASSVNFPVPSVTIDNTDPPAHREYAGGFVTKLAHKDLALAVSAANEIGEPLKLGRLTEELYRKIAAPDHPYANKDFSIVYKWLSEGGVEK
jgi:3-hydroxyisobutyrate dehydrogenase